MTKKKTTGETMNKEIICCQCDAVAYRKYLNYPYCKYHMRCEFNERQYNQFLIEHTEEIKQNKKAMIKRINKRFKDALTKIKR